MFADGFKCDIRARLAAEGAATGEVAEGDAVAMAGEDILVPEEPRAPSATKVTATCAVLCVGTAMLVVVVRGRVVSGALA